MTGRLLSSSTPPASEQKAQPGARTGKLDGEEGGGLSLPGAALGLLITGGLLGAGALVEARNVLG